MGFYSTPSLLKGENMVKEKKKSSDIYKEKKIKNEIKRLTNLYAGIETNKSRTVKGVIERAAFMRVSLDSFEKDLIENGYTEGFCQGDQEPYDRKRPVADLYNTMNTSYQKIIKQLTDLLPKEEIKPSSDDAFGDFVNNRYD